MRAEVKVDDHWLAKAGATVFVTVLAPVLVAVGMKVSDRVADAAKPADPPKVEASQPQSQPQPQFHLVAVMPASPAANSQTGTPAAVNSAAPVPVVAVAQPQAAADPYAPAAQATAAPQAVPAMADRRVAPPEIKLFNGIDLQGFYTWLDAPQKHFGKNKDPGRVFSVKDGILRISGKCTGGLTTIKAYSNYHLTAEYRWAGPTWPPRESRARHSGVLLHCDGNDGTVKGAWMRSIKCTIIEGSTGDLKVMAPDADHPVSFAAASETRVQRDDGQSRTLYYYKPGAIPTVFSTGFVKRFPSGEWKDVIGFRGPEELEAPVGQWNLLECICDEDRITVRLNGHTVNEASHCSLRRGKIMLQSNGAAIELRSLNLQPLAAR